MAKKPIVYTNGPAEQGKHYIDSREHPQTVRCTVTFKKRLGPEQHEVFRREMNELVEALIAMDVDLGERELKRRPAKERWTDRSGGEEL